MNYFSFICVKKVNGFRIKYKTIIMTDKKYERYYNLAGKASFENWEAVHSSKMCGCYYCGHIFPPEELTEGDWIPDRHGRTAVCPKCGIDAVIGDVSGIPIRADVLDELYEKMFGVEDAGRGRSLQTWTMTASSTS